MFEKFVTPGFTQSTVEGIARYHYASIDSTQLEGRREVTPIVCTKNMFNM
jgi:hypothetical protein